MAWFYLPAEQIGSADAWSVNAGTKVDAVNSNDGDTTRIATNIQNDEQSFYCIAIDPSAANITRVDVSSRARDNDGGTQTYINRWRLGGNTVDGSSRSTTGSYAAYADESVARPGGGSFTPTDFPGGGAGFQMGVVKTTAGAAATVLVTEIWTYAEGGLVAGGYIYHIPWWIPPLAGFGHLAAREIAQIIAMSGYHVIPSRSEEFDRIRAEIRKAA